MLKHCQVYIVGHVKRPNSKLEPKSCKSKILLYTFKFAVTEQQWKEIMCDYSFILHFECYIFWIFGEKIFYFKNTFYPVK